MIHTALVAVTDPATAFMEIGAIALVLAVLTRVAGRLGMTAIPFFLVAGLFFGNGGVFDLDVSEGFVSLGAEIGVLLLLLALGLEYSTDELKSGLRTGLVPGVLDAVLNFFPGFGMGLLLGWSIPLALLLGGATWVSSSGVIAKVLGDLDRLGNRETPAVLNLLVFEDLAMAIYLPVVAGIVVGGDPSTTTRVVLIGIAAVVTVLWLALRWGHLISDRLARGSNEALLFAVFGLTLLVGGAAQRIQVSAAIGAFLVGLALSGEAQKRASLLIEPLRDLFAGIFFLFFSFQIDPGKLPSVLLPAAALVAATAITKVITGAVAAARIGVSRKGRVRAGLALVARGEFSIVIASLGAGLVGGPEMGTFTAAYVLMTALVGPILAKNSKAINDAGWRIYTKLRPSAAS